MVQSRIKVKEAQSKDAKKGKAEEWWQMEDWKENS